MTMTTRRVVVAGATGLVGSHLVRRLCADRSVAAVHVLVRRTSLFTDAKIVVHVVDFTALPALPAVDEVYLALGTTIRVAGSQSAFRAVDFDANLAVARAARAAGATRAGLVSAMGANAASRVFYSRVKGELEQTLQALDFDALVIARPALLRGDRVALGQPARAGEGWATRLDRVLRPVLPKAVRAIAATDVAAALARRVLVAHGYEILHSAQMQGSAGREDGIGNQGNSE